MPGSDLLMKLNPWWCLTAGATAFETYRQLPADCADTDDKTKFTVHGWQLTVFPNYTIRVIRGKLRVLSDLRVNFLILPFV